MGTCKCQMKPYFAFLTFPSAAFCSKSPVIDVVSPLKPERNMHRVGLNSTPLPQFTCDILRVRDPQLWPCALPPLTDRKWPPAAVHGPWSLSAPSAGIARTAWPDLSAHKPEPCLTDPSGTAPLHPRRLSVQQRQNIHLNPSLSALLHRYATESRVRADACEVAFIIQALQSGSYNTRATLQFMQVQSSERQL